MTIALVIFSVTCNYDILSQTLPAGQQIMGFFGLFALDFGLLCWLFWTTRASAPGFQRVLGTIMIIIDLAGVAAGIIGDMMLNFNPETRASIGLTAVWVIAFVIIANIGGAVAAEISNPDQESRDSEREFNHELTHQKAKALKAQAAERAAAIADIEATHRAGEMMAAFQRAMPGNNGNGRGTWKYQKAASVPEPTRTATIPQTRSTPSRRAIEAMDSDPGMEQDETADLLNKAVAYVNMKIARGRPLDSDDQQIRAIDVGAEFGAATEIETGTPSRGKVTRPRKIG